MALLFILVAATVGFIIVTAATALTGRAAGSGGVSRETADQRQYVLRSAARLIEDELVGDHGAYVCVEQTEVKSGSNATSTVYLASGLLDRANAAAFVQGSPADAPTTVLEYLVWKAKSLPNTDALTGKNAWSESSPSGYPYQLDILITVSGGTPMQNWIARNNEMTSTTVDLLCRLTADEDLNITAEIGYLTGNKENIGTIIDTGYGFERPAENIVLTFPSVRTDFPKSTMTDPATGAETTTERYQYEWRRG